MWKRLYRMRRRILAVSAALPLMQAGGCVIDPTGFAIDFATSFGLIVAQGVIGVVTSSIVQLLLRTFPGSDILQALLGGNAGFF